MEKILIILPLHIYPLDNGGAVALFQVINEMKGKYAITLIMPDVEKKRKNTLEEQWNLVKFLYYKKEPFVLRLIRKARVIINKYYWLVSKRDFVENLTAVEITSRSLLSNVTECLRRVVLNELSENKYDLVQIEFYDLIDLIEIIPEGIKTLFVHHEIRTIRCEREYVKGIENPKDKELIELVLKNELNYLSKYNSIICVSDVDAKWVSEKNPNERGKIYSSPFSIKMDEKKIKLKGQIEEIKKLIYIGGGTHLPNFDAMNWFARNIWPGIIFKFPMLKLEIVGKWNSKQMNEIKNGKNIEFKGFVPNLHDVCSNSIMILPLRVGSGMRMKLIEAANLEIPVVTTWIGAEGFEFKDNFDCMFANTEKEFIESLEKLILNPSLAKQLGMNMKTTVEAKYSHHKLIKKRIDIYCDLFKE